MSSRGRGYGGRGYGNRGGGYRGSFRGNSSRGSRGGYNTYNSDSRYNNSSARYSSRDRIEEPYKKSYRSESSTSYSNRDYSGRSGSPERKRMRLEGSSDRRMHDGGGHYGGSYSSRQENYGGDRRSFGGDERRRSPSRELYRKTGGMGPPREPLRSTVRPRAPRRTLRGRTMRSRGSFRGAPRSRGTFSSRRFGDRSLGYTRALRTLKIRSSVKKEEEASSTEEDWDADEKEEVAEKKRESIGKSPKISKPTIMQEVEDPEISEGEGSPAEEVGGEDTDKEGDAGSDVPPPPTRTYVHLACVHCKEKCKTFSGYARHLLSVKHRAAMGAVARRHKAQLLRMRVAQRSAQRELEAAAGAELAERTTYCLICRLNHRTTKQAHSLTDTHQAMKRFLLPFCRICRVTFRSPMIYEHHICSIDHLKKKANQSAKRASPKAEGSGDEGEAMDVDLDNFMTLDSVGDVDEVEDDDSGADKKDEIPVKKPKVEINIGNEHVKKMEVWWCELCRVYLPRADSGSAEESEALRRHCRLRVHLRRYVQHRDTRTLRKQAERIHRQLHQKDADKESAAENTDNADKIKTEVKSEKTEQTSKKMENGTDVSGIEDKLWADVDKDIGDLLREVDPQGNEASDDEEDLGRYDKFRKSDKKPTKSGEVENETNAVEQSAESKVVENQTPA